ncbi:MAG: YkgJ family cysteine cluster protein [Candidatus Omnitrophica bacterium]|nr:YkgJ family cysteine cluster protein [Candidatus Omnitrophota bacterium]
MSSDMQFECKRCLTCCATDGYVYVTEREIEQIATYLNFEISFFINTYCVIIRPRFALKSLKNGTCIFLSDKGCVIYPVRPSQCVEFPLKWRTSTAHEYCKGLQQLATKESSCR